MAGGKFYRAMVGVAIISFAITGCSGVSENVEPSVVPGVEVDETSEPTTEPEQPEVEAEEDDHAHEIIGEEEVVAFGSRFAANLTNRTLPTSEWRSLVIPDLYDENLKQIYSNLDPYSLPFCSALTNVEISGAGSFDFVLTASFASSNSKLVFEVADMRASNDAPIDYKVTQLDAKMVDEAGC